jgi:hypothetical protein
MKIITRQEAKSLGLIRYYTGKLCKRGHAGERTTSNGSCCDCTSIKTKREADGRREYFRVKRKEYYYANQDEEKLKSKIYREENKEKVNASNARYRNENKEILAEKSRKYRNENRDYMINLQRDWRSRNPENSNVRKSLYRLEVGVSVPKNEAILGYTRDELISHIESQFKDGMNWDERSLWHIDHIKPVSLFLKQGVTDPSVVNALSNLQVLWRQENINKGINYQE